VGDDTGCGIVAESGLDDLAGVDARAVDGAAEELLEGDDASDIAGRGRITWLRSLRGADSREMPELHACRGTAGGRVRTRRA
jgi:hypothetical protein